MSNTNAQRQQYIVRHAVTQRIMFTCFAYSAEDAVKQALVEYPDYWPGNFVAELRPSWM